MITIKHQQSFNDLTEYYVNPSNMKDYVTFRAQFIYTWGWLRWLQKKLGISFDLLQSKGVFSPAFRLEGYDNEPCRLIILPTVYTELEMCRNRFAVSILSIQYQPYCHTNCLIFDTIKRSMLRFEPNGKNALNFVDSHLKYWAQNNKWNYISPSDYQSVWGMQTFEHIRYITDPNVKKFISDNNFGYCAAWSVWFVHIILANPDLQPIQILSEIQKWPRHFFALRIRQYIEFIIQTINNDNEFKTEFLKNNLPNIKIGDSVTNYAIQQLTRKIAKLKNKNLPSDKDYEYRVTGLRKHNNETILDIDLFNITTNVMLPEFAQSTYLINAIKEHC